MHRVPALPRLEKGNNSSGAATGENSGFLAFLGGDTIQTVVEEKPGEALRALREFRGLSIGETSRRSDVAKATLQHWEAGRNLPLGASLARVLDALEADGRLRARLLDAADPRYARLALEHTPLGAPVDVGMVLRTMRSRRGTTQAELARAVGVTQSALAKWESGGTAPSKETIHAVGFALGATVEETLALASCSSEAAPPGVWSVPEEAHAYLDAVPRRGELEPFVLMGFAAEAWRRAVRDPRWDSALCGALSRQADVELLAGRVGPAEALARRVVRLAQTPESRKRSMPALDIWATSSRKRGEDKPAVAELTEEWAGAIPDGKTRSWALLVHAQSLNALGRESQGFDSVRQGIEMLPTRGHCEYSRAWGRADYRVRFCLAGPTPQKAFGMIELDPVKNIPLDRDLGSSWVECFIAARAYHATGLAAPEEWIHMVVRGNDHPQTCLRDRLRVKAMERRQRRLRR